MTEEECLLDPHEALHEELSDRYELKDVLGEGGMGTVYLARDRRHDRLVAIKTVRPDLTTGAVRERFRREISITAKLQHPYILPLLHSGVAGETLYYVMPFVEGESLRSRLDQDKKLPIDQAVRIAGDVAEGLECAHRDGIIHRDIKPENILLRGDHALIVDFGIAKALVARGADTLTQTGWGPGSPNYMAPEQITGEATARSDIYALGSVLYEAATGHRWRAATDQEPDWSGVPTPLRRVIERALSPAPDERWPDAKAFRRALVASARTSQGPRRAVALGSLAAVLLVAGSWYAAGNLGNGSAESNVGGGVAVLPLVNLTGDVEQQYFVAGMHEALIAELSRVQVLDVISRTSVTRYAGTELSVPQIASELGVDAVVEGGVQKAGSRVRVNVQLIDARADRPLWAQTYDEELTTASIFAIQTDIARKIVAQLQATLAPEVLERIEPRPPASFEAYDLYTRARYLYNRFATYPDRERAADLFRRAIEADSAYAPAYVGLAEAYSFLASAGYLQAEEALPLARAAVERALELDESLAEAHAALGGVLLGEFKLEEAERAFQRALRLNPSSADVHRQYGRLLNRLARFDEAIREARRAIELDPLSVGNRVSLTSRLFNARQYESAIAEGRGVLEIEPDDVGALFFMGASYVMSGRFEEGINALRRAAQLDPENQFRVTVLAFAYARSGRRTEAVSLLGTVEERGPLLKEIAIVYGELGELDRAFEYLDRAYEEDRGSLTFLPADPTADSLRADPRFDELLEKVGFDYR